MCHALAEVVVLDFRGTEVQRYGGERIEIARTLIAQGQEGSVILVETY